MRARLFCANLPRWGRTTDVEYIDRAWLDDGGEVPGDTTEAVDGEKASDPRNYLYIEAKVGNLDSGVAVLVRLRGEDRWLSSHLGRNDYAISRDGWVRTTVELPPGTKEPQIDEIGFECLVSNE